MSIKFITLKKIFFLRICIILFIIFIFGSCEKKDDTIIDPTYYSPIISGSYKSIDTVFTSSATPAISFSVSVSVDENNGGSIKSVTCKVIAPDNLTVWTFQMNDNGILPDSIANDRRYSCNVSITDIQCLLIGAYGIQLIAENTSGLISNTILLSIPVVNQINQPPVLSNLLAPDSIHVPVSGQLNNVLSLVATDPDGKCDIRNVYFKSFKPDGSPSNNGNPIYLYDDGDIPLHGDTTANDSRYSCIIAITSAQTTLGPFKFVYEAFDNSNAQSQQLIDTIYVVQP